MALRRRKRPTEGLQAMGEALGGADADAEVAPDPAAVPVDVPAAATDGDDTAPPRRRRGGAGGARRDGGLRLVVLAVVVGVVLAVAASLLQRPVAPATVTAGRIEPIGSAVLLCPEPGAGSDLGVRVTAAVVPGQPGQDVEDPSTEAGLRTLPGKESASAKITVPGGQAQIEAFGTRLPAIAAYGEAALAPGLVADQWGRDPTGGAGRGLASTACAPAASEFWFVGGGAIAGRRTRIVLVNPDDTAAIADVIVRGPEGLIDTPGGRGLVVKGQDRLILRLDTLAPGVTATAVQVIVRTGRVGAAVDDEQRSGLSTVGTDWVPQAAAPATRVYVPGIVNGKGARVLSIAAPGDDDAIVNIRVISADGTYAPVDRAQVQVPADSVVAMDMSTVLDGAPATLELTSDTPIVAGMRQFYGANATYAETSFTAGAQPFSGPAAVSGLPVRANTDVRLGLTAPDGDAVVDVTLLPYESGRAAAQATAPRTVRIGAGKVRWIRLSAPAGVDWYTAVVTPQEGSGPILVAHRVRERSPRGDLVTGYPWSPLRVQVSVPQSVQNPAVALR